MEFKFKKRFYVIAGLFMLFIFWIIWGFLNPSPDTSDASLSEPAVLKPYNYPFKDKNELTKFISNAQQIPNSDSFYGKYSQNKGVPGTFISYVLPKDSDQAANSFTDDKYTYLPAYFIDPNDPTAVDKVSGEGDPEGLAPILLAFPKGTLLPAQPSFNRVYGTIYWLSQYARDPSTITAAQQGEIANMPIFMVGSYEHYSPIQAQFPSSLTKIINVNINRGKTAATYTLDIKQIEFNASQTRVLVQITNNANFQQPGWQGPTTTTIDNDSGAPLECGDDSSSSNTTPANSGALSADDMKPGQTLIGYVICQPADPSKDITIQFPDLPIGGETGQSSDTFSVKIPKSN